MTYTDYVRELLLQKPIGMPIYTKIIAASLAEKFNLSNFILLFADKSVTEYAVFPYKKR